MSETQDDSKGDQQRDALLLTLLKTPPQPRPKHDREADRKAKSDRVESGLSAPADNR